MEYFRTKNKAYKLLEKKYKVKIVQRGLDMGIVIPLNSERCEEGLRHYKHGETTYDVFPVEQPDEYFTLEWAIQKFNRMLKLNPIGRWGNDLDLLSHAYDVLNDIDDSLKSNDSDPHNIGEIGAMVLKYVNKLEINLGTEKEEVTEYCGL